MMPHDAIRLRAAKKLIDVNANLDPSQLNAELLTNALEAADVLADYTITRFIDRLRARGYHTLAAMFDIATLPPRKQDKEKP